MNDLRDHGIAVHNGSCLSMKPWRDAASGRDYIYCGIISTTSLVVQVDVQAGRSRSFYLPAGCEGPWGMSFALDGHVLVTSCGGQLCRIDPQTGKSWVAANTGKWLWTIDRGADGKFYLGSSSDCRLFRYDSVTDKLEDLGSLSPDQMYLRKIVCGNDGYVYCSIGCTASQIVAYHIASGRFTALLPKQEAQPYFLDIFGRGRDGQIYVHTQRGNNYRMAHGEAFRVEKSRYDETLLWGYFESLPDGRVITRVDPDALRVGDKTISYEYKTGGANIFHLAEGPGKAVYGSTIMPLYLLRYTPKTDKLENLGRGAPDNGEAYSFGHCDGKLYYGNYSLGNLMCYDPAKPWHKDQPGKMRWKTNPKLIGHLGRGNCRPRAMCIDNQKRVWVGGVPEYGYRHGGLACFDIRRKKLAVFDKIIPDQSIDALAADDDGEILYGGSNIGRGGGLTVIANEAYLFAWDTRRKKLLWKLTPIPGMKGVSNLLFRNGKLYGTSAFKFFCFDPAKKAMEYVIDSTISGPREHSVCFGADGNFYGITWMVMFRWHPQTGQIDELYRVMGDDAKSFAGGSLFHRGAIIINGRYYFSCGPKVMSLPVQMA